MGVLQQALLGFGAAAKQPLLLPTQIAYLVVGGGGGGNGCLTSTYFGSAGAGGIVRQGTINWSPGVPLSITVGSGGPGAARGSTTKGTNGSNSTLTSAPISLSVTATGGGGGGPGHAGGVNADYTTVHYGCGPGGLGGSGGNGAGGNLLPSSCRGCVSGGPGVLFTYNGITYGGGGAGYPFGNAVDGGGGACSAGAIGRGGGGGGGICTSPGLGGKGGPGAVILAIPTLRYPGSAPGATSVAVSSVCSGLTIITYTTPTGPASFTYTL